MGQIESAETTLRQHIVRGFELKQQELTTKLGASIKAGSRLLFLRQPKPEKSVPQNRVQLGTEVQLDGLLR